MDAPITAIIWDWNGTLLDDVDLAIGSMNRVLAQLGLPAMADRAAYRSVFGFPIRDYYGRLGIDISPDGEYEQAAHAFLAEFDQAVSRASLQPHARQVLTELGARGLTQVLISATAAPALSRQLAPHRVTELLDEVHGITDPLHPSKEHVVEQWLAGSGHSPEQVLMVGDTNHDREIAADLGVHFVAYTGGHQTHSPEADHRVIDDLRALLEVADHSPVTTRV